MRLPSLTILLVFTLGASASFTLVRDKKWYGTGCSLKIDDECGCSKKVNINHVYACDHLPPVYTHGNVCGGHWTLWTIGRKEGQVAYSKGKCSGHCIMGALEN
ncbi:MAG: hypothetical protein LQ348_000573, partial [Seirophora lacunosa]